MDDETHWACAFIGRPLVYWNYVLRLIKKIEVNYFRSLHSAQIDDASDLNIVFGKNDSGKSNLLKALNLFFNNRVENDGLEYRSHFDFDMNLSDARRSSAKKFVWVKVTFNTPDRFSNTLGQEVVVKRQWNSMGQIPLESWIVKDGVTIRQNGFSSGQKQQISRFLNSIDFAYIPAIKDKDAFASLIQRMYAAISQNEKLIGKTNTFIDAIGTEAESLTRSISELIPGAVTLSPPSDMERLFRNLDFSVGPGEHSLLWQKGDGIKARYIPEILRFINEAESRKKFFIWGFEEPENSLDLEAATAEAHRFKQFSQRADTQVFVTSHSPAFYLSEAGEGPENSVRRYFVSKQAAGEDGTITPEKAIRSIGDIDETEVVMAGAGLLRLPFVIRQIADLNKEMASERKKVGQLSDKVAQLDQQISALEKPTLYVEGVHDQTVICHNLAKMGHLEQINIFSLGGTPKSPHAVLKSLLEAGGVNPANRTFFLFDNDKAGRQAAKEISSVANFEEPVKFLQKTWTWVLPLRREYKEFLDRWGLNQNSAFSPMEFMFPPDEVLETYQAVLKEREEKLTHAIQGDIWKAVMNSQELSFEMQNLAETSIDWIYTRGVHDDLKGSFADKSADLSSDHLSAVLEKIIATLLPENGE